MAYELTKEFSFHAAHSLTVLPQEHKCSHLHGHTYRVLFTVRGELDPDLGWVVDFGVMAGEAEKLHEMLDHKYLNEIEGIDVPTSENLARFVFDRMVKTLHGLVSVTVYETPTSSCTYSPYETGVKIKSGPRRFSAVHIVLSEAFEEPFHGHDFSLYLEFYCANEHGLQAKDRAEQLMDRIVALYNNKTILPENPAQGELYEGEGRTEFTWKGGKLVLKPKDVKILHNQAHSTAEAIARDIALNLKDDLQQHKEIDMNTIRVFLQESPDSWVSVGLSDL